MKQLGLNDAESANHSPVKQNQTARVTMRPSRSALAFVLLLLAFVPALRAAVLVHEFYLPMPEAQIRQTFTALETNISNTIESIFSVVVTGQGTVIYYDQWEDGYETDLAHPTQSSTQIWGDGNDLNGIPPGFAHDPVGLPAGTVISLRNQIPLPRNPANLLFDARDRVAATKALVVSRTGWPTNPGSVLAGAVEVMATMDYGTNYVSPVGQDMTNKLFQYCGIMVMASEDNTTVTIDTDGAGVAAPFNIFLNRGESYLVNGGVKKGASIISTKPIQVDLVTGHIGAKYASDWFTLYPAEQWSDSYYTPVGTVGSNPTYAYFFNPNSTNITINVTTRIGSATLTVAANGGVTQYQMPANSGAKFTSVGGAKFFALSTVGANPSSDAAYDWGFTFLPADGLTTEAVVGWGPGSTDGSVNGSPAWVTPIAATRVYIDYNGDRNGPLTDPNGNKYDVHYDLAALQSKTVYDPDKDQTAMRLYTLDGTPISVAWGEDPSVASPGNPYIDAGTTVLPFPVPVLKKTSRIVVDTNAPGLSVGDVLEYSIELNNKGLLPLGNTVVLDAPSGLVSYLPGSTTLDGNPIPDSVSGTPFPLDAPGYTIPIILRAGTSNFKYRMTVTGSGTISNYVSAVGYGLSAATTIAPPPTGGATACALDFTDSGGTPLAAYTAGATIYVKIADNDGNTATNSAQSISVMVSNITRGDYEIVTLNETGNNTGIFRNLGGLASSTSAGVGQNDGTLNVVAGDVISVRYNDPVYLDTCNASASIQAPPQTKVLYLSDPAQSLDRINPVAAADNTTAQTVELGGGASATIGVDAVSSTSGTSGNSLAVSHTTGAGANRLMLVGVSTTAKGGSPTTVSSVTYGTNALVLVAAQTQTAGPTKPRAEIWRLVNPPSGTFTVTVNLGGNLDSSGAIVGVTTFTNVDQATPLSVTNIVIGGSANPLVTVASATGELIFDTVATESSTSLTVGGGQTQRWSVHPGIWGAGSTKPGAASVTSSWTNNSSINWALGAVSIKPALAGGGGPNATTFTQSPAFCQPFVMPVGGSVTITNFVTVTSGSMPANPSIIARLLVGSTNIITLSNPTYSAANSNLVWTGTLGSGLTIPAGNSITYVVSNAQAGVGFKLDYDSAAKPAKISIPTTTVIDVSSVGVYDAPYPGGNLVNTPIAGATLYVRSVVSDPFGSYDISAVNLLIDGPGASGDINTSSSAIVADDGCTRVYEYVWQTGSTAGVYDIAVTANEGSEGITDSAGTSVELTFLDLGTPSTTEFTSGNNGTATNAFPVNTSLCIRVIDQDQNLNATVAETLTVTVTSSAGDSETVTLTETGINTGIFTGCVNASAAGGAGNNNGTLNAPAGSILTASYTDPTDGSDQSSTTGTVLTPPGVPAVIMNKTLVSPADGQAGVGEAVIYNLQVVNSGSTTLSNVSVSDTFPAANLSFQSASLSPTGTNANTLTWANLGILVPGASTNLTVSFVATATSASAVNFATVNGGTVTNTGSVGVTITHAGLTITKTVLNPTNTLVQIGSNVTFRIVVQNSGDTAITSLPLEDSFSAGCYQFVSATVTPDGSGAGSLLWNDITGAGSLAPGNSITIDVTLLVTGGCDPANNTAHADFAVDTNGDPVPTATSTTGVTTGAGRVTGHVYNDPDQTGTLTPGDFGLFGVSVGIYSDPNADGDPSDGTLVRLVTTDLSGAYELLNLSTGAYVVVETDLVGYGSVAPLNNRLPVVLTSLTTNANNNFFDYLIPPISYATISGTVWGDTNANGIIDLGETGIGNVTVELVQDVNTNGFADLGETVAASTTTDTNGAYTFVGVTPGNYVIRETDLYGWFSTADIRPPNDNQIGLLVGSGAVTNGNDFLDFFTGNNPGNDAPVANNDTYGTSEDSPLNISAPGVLGNDTDVDGDALNAVLVGTTTHGTLTLNPNGSFSYLPNTNYNGSDSFTYRANDGTTNSGIATVNITISAVNDAPIANNQFVVTPEDVSTNLVLTGSDVESTITFAILAGPTHGSLSGFNASSGAVTYSPTADYNGPDGFTFTVTDGSLTATGTVSITVLPVNDPPVAVNDSISTPEDTTITIPVLVNDSDPEGTPLSIIGVTTTNGTANVSGTNVVFTPATNFNGTVVLGYTISDGTNTTSANITVTVTAVNDTPIANNDAYSLLKNATLTIPAAGVLTNDTDVENDALSAFLVANVTHGTLTFNANGGFTYTPVSNYVGSDVFTYRAYDAGATSGIATVTLTIGATNTAPVANGDTFTTLEDVALNIPAGGVLTNDVDVDGDALTTLLISTTTHGTLTLNPNGSFAYTPNTNYSGSDSFTYRALDGQATSGVATVTINITPVNDAPVANNDAFSLLKNTTLTIPVAGVLTNDTDVENDALSALLVTNVTHGTLTLSTNGSFTYTPVSNYVGSDVFAYVAFDGTSNSAVALVTLTVVATNTPPTANNDTFTTLEDAPLNIPTAGVLTNDIDVDADALTALLVSTTTHGTLTLNPDGSFIYTPNTNYNGSDSFTYRALDGQATSAVATVTINITPVNDAPIANNDVYGLLKNATLNVPATGVLGNDTDAENDPLSAFLVANVTHGTLTLNANGSFTYTPVSNYVGSDVFTYQAYDAGATSGVATVTLNIGATNTPPTANGDIFTTLEDVALNIPAGGVLTNDVDVDGDALAALLVSTTTHGTLTLNPNGSFSYTPNTNYNGSDSFTYRASDGQATSAVATVTINITPVNDAPIAVNDAISTPEDTTVTIPVLVNDSDPEGTPLTITLVTTTNGTANAVGTNVVFTPATNFNGTVVLGYTISDGTNTATANVTVTVTPVDDAPVTINDAFSLLKNATLTIPVAGVLTNDTDVENDALSALLVANVTHGTLALGANGGFTYTPVSNYVGSDVFSYRAYDAGATGSIATVTLTILATNTPPTANNDTFTILEDTTLTIPAGGVLTNDVDPDGDTLTALLFADVAHGTLTLNTNGGFTYTPATNYSGTDFFIYQASDGFPPPRLATVTINITPVNDAPIAVNDSISTPEDTAVTIPVLVNDSDAEGTPLTITLVTTTNGTASVAGTNVVFTPATNFFGTVVLGYTISDGTNTASANITVTVTPVNDAPVAINDAYSLFKNATLTIPATGVLTNDTDVENDALTALLAANVVHGTLTLNANGGFVYTPVSNYVGSDAFAYRARDGSATSGVAIVTLTILATNTPPTANNDTFTTLEDAPLNIPAGGVLTNDVDVDGDALTALLASTTTHGTLTLNANGSFSYTPTTNYNGTDSFTYRARDGQSTSTVATVTINITPVNDTPVANNDAFSLLKNATLTIPAAGVLTNDTDVENDALSALLVANVTHGTLTLNANGGFVYTPVSNYVGSDAFTYRAYDASATSGVATVTLTVVATNTPPTANNDSFTTLQGVPLNVPAAGVLTNDVDVDGDALTALLASTTTHGTLTLNANGSFNYSPNTNYNGNDSFTYRARDGQATSAVATVTINITAAADVAVGKSGSTNVAPGAALIYTISVTNFGPSVATNVVVVDTLPTNAVFVSASANGSFASGVVTWPAISTLAVNAVTNFTVTINSPTNGSFINIASATTTTVDPNPSNNDGSGAGSQVVTAVVPVQFGILQGANVLNPQTGLFEQRVTVTNVGPTIAAFRLLVGNINGTNGVPRTNVTLVNATGTNVDSRPYVQYNAPLNQGQTVQLILEFRVPDRRPFTNSLEAEAVLPTAGGTNSGVGVFIDRAFQDLRFAEPRFVIEWTSVPGKVYTVIYSDDGATTWHVATPTVTATANRVQWYDDGPPKTLSKPASVTSRLYRVIAAP